jgi:hypothetical protein
MTFEQLKDKLARWVGANSTKRLSDAERGESINMAMRDLLRRYDLRFGEHSDTIVTAASDYDYTIPSNWVRAIHLWYLSSDKDVITVDYKPKPKFDVDYPDRTEQGNPDIFTVFGSDILIGPTPDAVYTINRDYYGLLADLADGAPANTNIFIENAWEPIFFNALVKASLFLGHDQRVQMWKNEAEIYELRLTQEHSRARSSARKAVSEIPG